MLSEYEIRAKIDSYYYKISCLEMNIKSLHKKLEELYQLKQRYILVENNFNQFNRNKLSQAKRINESIKDFKFSQRFSEVIMEYINGPNAARATNNIDNTKSRINQKINEVERNISEYKLEINTLNDHISELEYKLKFII